MAGVHYDPLKSETAKGGIDTFVSDDVSEDLTKIPGVGPAYTKALEDAGFTSTIAVIGKFLSLHEKGMSSLDHCEAFGKWLTDVGINTGSRNTVVRAIAEKCNRFMKGLCDHSTIVKAFEDRD